VDTGSGIRLLVADARVLKAFRLDPGTGFVMTGQDSTDRPMGRPSAGGDFDADGRLEVALAGESGGIVIFEVTDQAVTAETGLDASNPMLALRSRAVAGGPDELFSMELEPYFLRFEGDFIRRLSRLRRWRHDGQALVTVSTVSFAGFDFGGDVDLHDLSGDLVLRRRERFDVVAVDADAVGWGETLATSSIPVTGSVLATFPSGVPWIWAGTSAATMDPGEGITVVPGSTHRGGPLQVEAAASVPGGVRVELVWNDLCASESLLRSGPVRGTYAPPSGAGMAVDTLALGETVTFTLTTPTCSVRTLQLTGRTAPLPLSFAWADSRTLVVDLPRPLPGSPGSPVPPGEVALHDVPGTHPVRSVQVLNGGTRLWIAIPEETPADTLLIGGTWYADGYPLGGRATRVAHALPPRPDPVADPVLAAVRYGPAGGWHLEVTLGGGPFTCPGGFVLEPPGTPVPTWEPAPAGAEYTLRIPLAAPLRPGTYTLRFGDPCLGERISPLGTEVIFRAGPLVYPNPIPPEGDLVVENMEPGSRVHVLDLRGEERASFTVEGAAHRRPVTDLAPGLYILRIEDPEGRLVSVQKIVIRR
jgi:hypothetical protein